MEVYMASALQLQGRIEKLHARIQARQQELAGLLKQCREVRNQLAAAKKAAKPDAGAKAARKKAKPRRGGGTAKPAAATARTTSEMMDREAEE